MARRILSAKPSITQLEIDYVADAISNGWGEHCYDYIYRFQNALAEYLGARHVFATASCTGALHLALMALDIGPGDEVIVPDATWIATAGPIAYLGATPVFVDILPESWCIDPAKLEGAITPRTKAVIIVHLYGNLAEMDVIKRIAADHGIAVVEDAAEAMGSEYHGHKAGSMGDLGAFSFHGTKTITTGEGGALVTNRDDLAEIISVIHSHGRDPEIPKMFWCERIGLKYKMSNLQAALGCAQLERLEELVAKKREVFRWYLEAAEGIPDLTWNPEPARIFNSYWMPTVILGESQSVDRDDLLGWMNEHGVAARPFFYPVSSFSMFETCDENQVAYRTSSRGLCLPNYFEMKKDDVRYVVETMVRSGVRGDL